MKKNAIKSLSEIIELVLTPFPGLDYCGDEIYLYCDLDKNNEDTKWYAGFRYWDIDSQTYSGYPEVCGKSEEEVLNKLYEEINKNETTANKK